MVKASNVRPVVIKVLEKVAVKKANSNCFGLMYEPKRPVNIIKKD